MLQDFFYDGQVRRFISQFIRIVSNLQVEFGANRNGVIALQRVPVYYGDSSRQVASILKNNSESTLNAVPAMSVYVGALQYDRERVQDPFLVDKVRIRERLFDPDTGEDTHTQGDLVSVDRVMPVPYKLTLKLDIWSSNTEQKLQILEQLMIMFNPAMEIQNSDNVVDWGSLSVVFLTDVNWSSRTVPVGTEEPIDVATMTFELPIWISAPVAVKKYGAIKNVITSLYGADGGVNSAIFDEASLLARISITPLNYNVVLRDNQLFLYNAQNKIDTYDSWPAFIDIYGKLNNGISQIKLLTPLGNTIVGTVSFHPTDNKILIVSLFQDTLPRNTQQPINAIIDPYHVNVDDLLLSPAAGTRYLITEPIGKFNNAEGPVGWRGSDNRDLVANAQDIIEFNGTNWIVVFDSLRVTTTEYVSNLTTGMQFCFTNGEWVKSIDGLYQGGRWTLTI